MDYKNGTTSSDRNKLYVALQSDVKVASSVSPKMGTKSH